MKKYEFESRNKGTVTVEITGESDDGKDLWVVTEDADETFEEIDGGAVETVMLWMLAHGVEFESAKSFRFNACYIQSVMLDADMTEEELMDESRKWGDCRSWMGELVDDTSLTIAEAAKVSGVSRQRIQQLIDNGTLDAHLVGKRMKLVDARDVVEWANSDRKPGNPHKRDEYIHNAWNGEGWYRIAFSDGGQDWTNNGPLWFEQWADYDDEMTAARETETEFHLCYSDYLGDGDRPER